MNKITKWYWKQIYANPEREASFDWLVALVVGSVVCLIACWVKQMNSYCRETNTGKHVWRQGKWDLEQGCSQCGIELTEMMTNDMMQKYEKLKEYAQHKYNCDLLRHSEYKCDCGLEDILK